MSAGGSSQKLTLFEFTEPPAEWYGISAALQDAMNVHQDDGIDLLPQPVDEDYPSTQYTMRNFTIGLWPSGCLMSDGSHDCTTACMTSSMVWNASAPMTTFQNCLVYDIVAQAAYSEQLDDPRNLSEEYNMSYPFEPLTSINECISAVGKPIKDNGGYITGYVAEDFAVALRINPMNCSGRTGSLNPDIGGQGVLISYYTQLAILLVLWLSIGSMSWFRSTFEFKKGKAAIITTAVEFQKTQIFFASAIQIASLLALTASDLNASDWMSLQMNDTVITVIGYLGLAPPVLNLLNIRKDRSPEWFLMLLTMFGLVASSTTLLKDYTTTISPAQTSPAPDGIPACGNFHPAQTCMVHSSMIWSVSGMAPLMPIMLPTIWLVWMCLVLEKLKVFKRSSHRKGRALCISITTIFRLFSNLAEFYLVSMVCLLVYMLSLYSPLEARLFCRADGECFNSAGVSTQWTFGQVIAVAIWVPLVIEWMHLTIVGMEEGFKHVLSSGYKVVKKTSTGTDPTQYTLVSNKDERSSGIGTERDITGVRAWFDLWLEHFSIGTPQRVHARPRP